MHSSKPQLEAGKPVWAYARSPQVVFSKPIIRSKVHKVSVQVKEEPEDDDEPFFLDLTACDGIRDKYESEESLISHIERFWPSLTTVIPQDIIRPGKPKSWGYDLLLCIADLAEYVKGRHLEAMMELSNVTRTRWKSTDGKLDRIQNSDDYNPKKITCGDVEQALGNIMAKDEKKKRNANVLASATSGPSQAARRAAGSVLPSFEEMKRAVGLPPKMKPSKTSLVNKQPQAPPRGTGAGSSKTWSGTPAHRADTKVNSGRVAKKQKQRPTRIVSPDQPSALPIVINTSPILPARAASPPRIMTPEEHRRMLEWQIRRNDRFSGQNSSEEEIAQMLAEAVAEADAIESARTDSNGSNQSAKRKRSDDVEDDDPPRSSVTASPPHKKARMLPIPASSSNIIDLGDEEDVQYAPPAPFEPGPSIARTYRADGRPILSVINRYQGRSTTPPATAPATVYNPPVNPFIQHIPIDASPEYLRAVIADMSDFYHEKQQALFDFMGANFGYDP